MQVRILPDQYFIKNFIDRNKLTSLALDKIQYIVNNSHLPITHIAKDLGISKTTVFKYINRTPEDNARIRKTGQQTGALITLNKLQDYSRNLALQLFEKFKNEELFLIGLALYWAEGRKTTKFSISNTDPRLLKIFHTWLKTYLPQAEVTIRVQHPIASIEVDVLTYWKNAFPDVKTVKTYLNKSIKSKYGVCNFDISGIRGIQVFIDKILELYKNHLEVIYILDSIPGSGAH